jgi:hypothetical protein
LLWAIARIDLQLGEEEFLSLLPAALELLMRRLEIRDRKRLLPGAMVSAELWNIHRDREKHPDSFSALDFLPELPEERRRREQEHAREQARTAQPPTSEQLAAFKARLLAGHQKKH